MRGRLLRLKTKSHTTARTGRTLRLPTGRRQKASGRKPGGHKGRPYALRGVREDLRERNGQSRQDLRFLERTAFIRAPDFGFEFVRNVAVSETGARVE